MQQINGGFVSAINDDAEEMLCRANIDCVDIVIRPDSHLPLVEAAARAGKHILCQKPFAPFLEEAERMVEAAERHRVRIRIRSSRKFTTSWITPSGRLRSFAPGGLIPEKNQRKSTNRTSGSRGMNVL